MIGAGMESTSTKWTKNLVSIDVVSVSTICALPAATLRCQRAINAMFSKSVSDVKTSKILLMLLVMPAAMFVEGQ